MDFLSGDVRIYAAETIDVCGGAGRSVASFGHFLLTEVAASRALLTWRPPFLVLVVPQTMHL